MVVSNWGIFLWYSWGVSCNYPGKTKGTYLAAMAWILAWLEGKLELLGAELEVLADVVKQIVNEIGI